jgi:two-component system, NtrC family, response regulator AtoC
VLLPAEKAEGDVDMTVLIIDDEPGLRQTVSLILSDEGYEVQAAADGEEGLARALELKPDIILCDVRMPRLGGLEFLEPVPRGRRDRHGHHHDCVRRHRARHRGDEGGAYDYLPKPFSPDQLVLVLKKAEEREALRREVTRLREEVSIQRRYREIIAKSPAMTKALEVAAKVARTLRPC